MIYENNDILRDYLKRGGAEQHQPHAGATGFAFDDAEFERALDEIHEQHPELRPDQAEARAAFRLLTKSAQGVPSIAATPAAQSANADTADRRTFHEGAAYVSARSNLAPVSAAPVNAESANAALAAAIGSLCRRLVIAWAIAVVVLLAAIALLLFSALPAHAAPEPDLAATTNSVSVDAVLASLARQGGLLPQLGSAGARVQFLSGGNWSYVAAGTPFPVTCVSGCSSTGAFGDNSAFTVGTTAITPIGAFFTTGGAPSITSGNAGRVRMDSNSYLYVDCITGCSASAGFGDNSAFTAGSTAIGVTGGWYSASPTNCTSGNACAPQLTQDRKLFVQAFQGTSPWVVSANGGSFAVTQSGAWSAGQSGAWTVQPGNTANTTPWLVTLNDGAGHSTPAGDSSARSIHTTVDNASLTVAQATGSNLHVVCDSGCGGGSGGTSSTDEGAFAEGTTTFTPAGCYFKTSFTSLTTGQTGAFACTADRNLFINVNRWAGSALGAMANYGTSPGAVLAPGVNAFVTNTVAANATLQTSAGTDIGKLDANQSVNVAQVNGSATATAATGVQKVGIVGNAGAAVDAAFGAAPPANGIAVAGLGSGATGGELIGLPVGDSYKAVNISSATTTLIVTGVSGRQVRISALHLLAAAADNVAIIEGTGATCGTGTAGMAGGTTAASGYNFAANGGIAMGSGVGSVMQTATTGDSVCIVTSAAVQLSGGIQYTIF